MVRNSGKRKEFEEFKELQEFKDRGRESGARIQEARTEKRTESDFFF